MHRWPDAGDAGRQGTKEAKAALYALPDYQSYDYPAFGPGSGEAVRLDDASLGLD